jgi:UMF1 family MFS transporter
VSSVSISDPSRSVTGERVADFRGQLAWALFEFGRSPYISLVYVFVFPPYFATTIVGDPVLGQERWSLANTIAGACVALLAPLLGAVSDRTGARKPWLAGIAATMAVCCFALWYAMPGATSGLPLPVIVTLVIILAAFFQFTEVFHNAILPSIATPQALGRLSGLGIATGNLGTLLGLIVMLFGVALPANGITLGGLLPAHPLFGLDPSLHEHDRIAGPVAGLWLVLFTLPLLLWTPDRAATGVGIARAVRDGLADVRATVRHARRVANVGLFLIARMLYTDGKTAILAYIGIYAAGVFHWELTQLLLFALALAPFSITGGFIGGWLDTKLGAKRSIQIAIVVTCIAMLAIVSIAKDEILFMPYTGGALGTWRYFTTLPEILYVAITAVLAISITAAFCLSRTMMARISPPTMMNQFFGLYALSGTATAFLGHATVSLFTRVSGSQRVGFASTILLLVAGGIALRKVSETRAAAP